MDGIEALRQMVNVNANIPKIFFTAYDGYQQDFAAWAADGYILKSSDLGDIMACIRKHLKY